MKLSLFTIFFKRICEGSDWKLVIFISRVEPGKTNFSDREIPFMTILSGCDNDQSDPQHTMGIAQTARLAGKRFPGCGYPLQEEHSHPPTSRIPKGILRIGIRDRHSSMGKSAIFITDA